MTTNIAPGRSLRGLPGPPGADVVINDLPDFFRTMPGAQVPNGITDLVDPIVHLGHAGFGQGTTPFNANLGGVITDIDTGASLESAANVRTGSHPRAGGTFYSTGPMGSVAGLTTTDLPAQNIAAFMHDNGTQGIGFGYDGIYAAGSSKATQDIGFAAVRGQIYNKWTELNGGFAYFDNRVPALAANQGFVERHYNGNTLLGQDIVLTPAAGNGTRRLWQGRTSDNAFRTSLDIFPAPQVVNDFTWKVGGDFVNPVKLLLYGNGDAGSFGIGIAGSTQTYQVGAATRWHEFRGASGAAAGMRIRGDGVQIVVPALPTSPAGLPAGSLWVDPGPGQFTGVVRRT